MPSNYNRYNTTSGNSANHTLYSWERALLRERDRETENLLDDDLNELLRIALDDSPRAAPQPAPAPEKVFDKPLTNQEVWATLPIGAHFFLEGPNIGEDRWYKKRTKVSDTHYDTEHETTRRKASGWSRSTVILRTI